MKTIIKTIKMKISQKSIGQYNLAELENKGEYVLSLCINEESNNPYGPIEHHLPLVDPAKLEQDADNWDLPDKEKNVVTAYLEDLESYAATVVKVYNQPYSDTVDILPLWIVFPTYSATTIGWRMSLGEQYEDKYLKMLARKNDEELEMYKKRYPAPEYMKLRCKY